MTVRVEGKLLSKSFRKNLEKQIEKAVTEVAGDAILEIVQRTESGKSVNGGSFKSYTPEYRKFRSKKNRSTTPDLRFTGRMLGSITQRVRKRGKSWIAEIFFASALEDKKAQANQKIRDFFGLSKKQLRTAEQNLKRAIDLKDANSGS